MKFVSVHDADRELIPRDFWAADPDARVSLDKVHTMLDRAIERRRDEQLGLKLGRSMCFGQGGPFDYAVHSASTLRQSVAVATRYSRLLTDSFRVWFETWRGYAVIRLDSEPVWPRGAADFAMSAFYKLHLADGIPVPSQLECWFPYSSPKDTSEYRLIFPGATLKFDAPFVGFAFDRTFEQAPMPGADPVLHSIHCARLDSLLTDLSTLCVLKTRVRRLIEQEIRGRGSATVPRIARALNMSGRTMSRRLEQEGTSFIKELDDTRQELALSFVCASEVPFTEIAFLLGFSHAESFHRAFKRWTGETPLACRKQAHTQG
jgi:AraC-like DNA-binding protein